MQQPSPNATDQFSGALRRLKQLRRFGGPPEVFWPAFLESLAGIAGAPLAVPFRKTAGDTKGWERVCLWPSSATGNEVTAVAAKLEQLAESCLQTDYFLGALDGTSSNWGITLRVETEAGNETWVAALLLPGLSPPQATNALKNLRLAAHTPGIYQFQRAASQNQIALGHFSSVLDLMALLNAEHGFIAVAMTFCNELAARHKCDRVSLGWLGQHAIQLQVSSHTEKFEEKMEAVRALEQTMEEALDQDEIVVWPASEGDTVVTRDHELFAENQKVKFLCSVPLRVNGEPVAVVLCERNSEAFDDTEVRLLSLCAEMAARRLSELKRRDRWFGARWATAARELCAKAVGVEHTWAKVGAVAVALALGILFFGGMNYRIEAPFILRTDDLAMLSAPFNGYIDEVPVEIGDAVAAKAVMLKLDTRDLRLEEATALADLDRYTRESEKARATNALAEMRIATAQAEQARVHLESVRYHLEQATVTAPFSGVVVEGDLKKRIAAPLKQGDLLFKVARTDRMYVECDVWENTIHEVRSDAKGQIAFASQPRLKFPVRLERIEPVAQAKDQKNVFVVRCQFDCERQSWWRPGMSGVAKINVGHRTFFWILSHRTVDFLRMYFWV